MGSHADMVRKQVKENHFRSLPAASYSPVRGIDRKKWDECPLWRKRRGTKKGG